MKQLILTVIILLTFAAGLKSQNYVPFPTENANWNVYYVGSCTDRPPDTTIIRYAIHGDTTFYKVIEDTILQETKYKKLCIESGDTLNPSIKGIGGIREADKKIYYRGKSMTFYEDDEFLLYDFTKQAGDTIYHDLENRNYSVVVTIDSILIGGNYRKRYKVENKKWFYLNPDYIVEGIGSVKNGLLGHISSMPTCGTRYWEHICFKENGELKYLNPNFENCFSNKLIAGMSGKKSHKQIKIYPNPIDENLHIENNFNERLKINIIDINGRSIAQQELTGVITTMKLSVEPGIYYALITNRSGEILLNQKIIKQ